MHRKIHWPQTLLVTAASAACGLYVKHAYGGGWPEFFAFVTAVVSVYLAAVEHIVNWPISILSIVLYGWVFYQQNLQADAALQLFYLGLSVHGWWRWGTRKDEGRQISISRMSGKAWIVAILAAAVLAVIYYPVDLKLLNGSFPLYDSLLAAASIVAQLMENHKKLEAWALWILIDGLYIPLYLKTHLISTAVFSFLCFALAIWGLVAWTRIMNANSKIAAERNMVGASQA